MKNLLYIGNKLSRHGFSPTTVETLAPLLEGEGFSVTSVSDKKSKFFRLIEMLLTIWKRRKTVDIILIDTYSTSNFWFAYLAGRLAFLLRLKYIPILHGGNLPEQLRKNPNLCRQLFSNSYRNVSPSQYLFGIFSEKFPQTVFIPNAISIENYPFLERNPLAPQLLWVRSFAQIYNPKMAVDVLEIVQKKYPEASLCMVGPEKDGSLLATKTYAAKRNVDVTFTGKLSPEEWRLLSAEFSIFINTTHFDNLPVSVIEAMALGLPVISTNVGGIPYLISNGENGLLVADSDAKAMAENILLLIGNPSLFQTLTQNARNKAETFGWEHLKAKWSEILS